MCLCKKKTNIRYGNWYVIFGLKIFSLPVPTRPATRTFCHYPTRSRPEVKNHYPSVSAHQSISHQINPRCCSGDIVEWVSRLQKTFAWFFFFIYAERVRLDLDGGVGGVVHHSWGESIEAEEGWSLVSLPKRRNRGVPYLTKSVIVPGLPGFSTT